MLLFEVHMSLDNAASAEGEEPPRDGGCNTNADLSKSRSSLTMERWVCLFSLIHFSVLGEWMLLCHETDTYQNAKLRTGRHTPDH